MIIGGGVFDVARFVLVFGAALALAGNLWISEMSVKWRSNVRGKHGRR